MLAAALLILFAAGTLEAQSVGTASSFVPAGHWSYELLRRLDAAGALPPGSDVARRSIPQEEIAALLTFVSSDSSSAAAHQLTRFREEYPAPKRALSFGGASALGSYSVRENQVLSGIGYEIDWTGARPLDDESDADILVRTTLTSRVVAAAAATQSGDLAELQLVIATGAVGIWGGRKPVGFSVSHGGGVVVDRHTFDGGGFFLTRPVTLPVVGPVRFEMHISRIANVLALNDTVRDTKPWFWMARGSIEPHPRLRLALNRGVMFGGEGNLEVTASRVFKNLLGIYTSDNEHSFANQAASIDVRYRLPTDPVALQAYLEFGADDAAGAWWDVPGVVGGLQWSGLPRSDVSVGLERAEFSRTNPTNSIWYRNAWFWGSWADGGEMLGHPLGGHGTEWRAFASGGSGKRGFNADIAVYRRRRGEQNLVAPERAGRSTGVSAGASLRVTRSLRVLLRGEVERGVGGAGWTSTNALGGARFQF